jgi:hypothetical protein
MAALAAVIPSNNGTVIAGAAVAASDTISADQIGSKGAVLEIINGGGSPDVVAISDSGVTPAGSAATNPGSSVTNGTNKVFVVEPSQVNPSTQLVTVTHTFTTSVTYKLYSLSGIA